MRSMTPHSHVGSDGILHLQVPVELTDRNLEVMVIYQPLASQDTSSDNLGWPPGFLKRTAGTIRDLERPPQGESSKVWEAGDSF